MSKIVEGLLKYLENTSRQQIESDWAEFAMYDDIGPKVDEFIRQSHHYKMDDMNPWEINPQTIQNPEFSSDFFLTKPPYTYEQSNLFS